jgi:hypothetical protein
MMPIRSPDGRTRHCWILGEESSTPPSPGLLLEWSRAVDGRWIARVVYVPMDAPSMSIETWLDSRFVRPAPGS